MPIKKTEQQEFARILFIQHLSQKEIAAKVGVSEKTVGKWVEKGKWETLRKSLTVTKQNQLVFLYNQLDYINSQIQERDKKVGTPSEIDSISKLTAAIQRLEIEASLGENIEVLMNFVNFIKPLDFAFSKTCAEYSDIYIQKLVSSGKN